MRAQICKTLLLFLVPIICTGCTDSLEYPFTDVMKHYTAPEDSLKRRAVKYLAKYARYHHGTSHQITDKEGNHIADFCGLYNYPSDTTAMQAFKDSAYYFKKGERVPDAKALTPKYLIDNIDQAFDAWQRPWAKHIDFDLFCETLLPYRVMNEELSDWRSYLYEKYAWVADSIKDPTSTYEMMMYLIDVAKREVGLITVPVPYIGFLTPREMENIGYGSCVEDSQYFTMVLRAMGIPAAYTSARVTRMSIEHTGNVVFCKDTAFYTGLYEDRIFPVMPGFYDGAHLSRVIRKTFALSDSEPLPLFKTNNFPRSIDLFSKDISQLCDIDTLRYSLPDSLSDEKYAYLCIFQQWHWLPIRYSRIEKDGSVCFPNTVIDRLYTIGTHTNGMTTPVTIPFVFYGGCDFEPRIATNERHHQIQLTYPYNNEQIAEKRIHTNFLNTDNKWERIEGDGQLYVRDLQTGLMTPSDDLTTPGLDRRFVLTLKDIPRKTVFYDDSLYLLRLWGIGRDEACTPY